MPTKFVLKFFLSFHSTTNKHTYILGLKHSLRKFLCYSKVSTLQSDRMWGCLCWPVGGFRLVGINKQTRVSFENLRIIIPWVLTIWNIFSLALFDSKITISTWRKVSRCEKGGFLDLLEVLEITKATNVMPWFSSAHLVSNIRTAKRKKFSCYSTLLN